MARKSKDSIPSFYVETPETNVTARDFDIFYKPQQVPTNPAIKELTTALSEFVPTLSTYGAVAELRDKETNVAKAEADFQSNKVNFKQLVDNKEIVEGQNPHYYNKMMELELKNKAREFRLEFDEFYSSNDIAGRLSPSAFSDVYEQKMKEFYSKNNLQNYDPLALNNAFFKDTSKYRNKREEQHEENRFTLIKEETEKSAVRNFTDSFIDFSFNNAPVNEVIDFIQNEVESLVSVGVNTVRANKLFETSLVTYIDAISDEQGIGYARKVIDNLNLINFSGFGSYTSTSTGKTIQQQLKNKLAQKDLDLAQRDNNLFKQSEDRNKNNINKLFLKAKSDNQFISIDDFSKKNNFNPKEKAYLQSIVSDFQAAKAVKASDPDAIDELTNMRDKPFELIDKANEMLRNRRITITDYERFYSKGQDYNTLENDIVFKQSRTYQTFKKMFDDKNLTSARGMTIELPYIRSEIEEELLDYYNEQKKLGIDGKALSRRIDSQVKVIFFQKIQDGRFGQASEYVERLANNYGLGAYYKPKITEENKK